MAERPSSEFLIGLVWQKGGGLKKQNVRETAAGVCEYSTDFNGWPIASSSPRFWIDLKSLFAEALQFVKQRAAADAQRLGGLRAVEIMLAQFLQHGGAFDFLQAPGVGRFRSHRRAFGGSRPHPRRQVLGQNQFSAGEQHGALHCVA